MVATAAPPLTETLHVLATQALALVPAGAVAKLLRIPKADALKYLANLESAGWVATWEDEHDRMFVILSTKAADRLNIDLEPMDESDPFEQRWVRRGKAKQHRAEPYPEILLESDLTAEGRVAFLEGFPSETAPAEPESDSEYSEANPYGSSQAFARWLRRNRPGLVVPEWTIVPLLSTWRPTPEQAKPADRAASKCPKCGRAYSPGKPRYCVSCNWCAHCGAGVARKSIYVCLECSRSGWEPELAAQLRIVGTPPRRKRPIDDATRKKLAKVAASVKGKGGFFFPGSTADPRPSRRARRAAKFKRRGASPNGGRPSAGVDP